MRSIYQERPWLSSYPDWVPHDLDLAGFTAIEDFNFSARRRPEAPAIYYFDHVISYGEMERLSDALAVGFHDLGLNKGDRIIVDLQNVPQVLIAIYAAWKLGAIVVPVNPMYKEKELAYFCRDSGAKIFLTLQETAANLDLSFLREAQVNTIITTSPLDFLPSAAEIPGLLQGIKRTTVEGALELSDLLAKYAGKKPDAAKVSSDDIAYLTYTSGTTGRPKGAMNTHRNVAFSARVYRSMMRLDETDVVLGVAPLFHVTGEVAHSAVAALVGIPLVLYYRFDPGETLRLIERWKVTMTVAAITVYIALINHPDIKKRNLSSFIKAYSGGAPVSEATVKQFEDLTGLYLHNVYGMTETTSPSHIVPWGKSAPVDKESGALSVGVPVPNSVIRIVDDEKGARRPGPRRGGRNR